MTALQALYAAVLAFSYATLATPTPQGSHLVPCKTNSDCQSGQTCLDGWAFSKNDEFFCGVSSKTKKDLAPCKVDADCEIDQECINSFFFSREGNAYCGYSESKRQLPA